MIDIEASGLATRYKNLWRGGPSVDELRAQFTDMDAGTAGTMLIRLARTDEHAPSIARLWHQYRQLDTPANMPLPSPPCPHCDGDGWTTVELERHGRTYRAAQPCPHCDNGRHNSGLTFEHSHWPT
jgi:hypothetical protein